MALRSVRGAACLVLLGVLGCSEVEVPLSQGAPPTIRLGVWRRSGPWKPTDDVRVKDEDQLAPDPVLLTQSGVRIQVDGSPINRAHVKVRGADDVALSLLAYEDERCDAGMARVIDVCVGPGRGTVATAIYTLGLPAKDADLTVEVVADDGGEVLASAPIRVRAPTRAKVVSVQFAEGEGTPAFSARRDPDGVVRTWIDTRGRDVVVMPAYEGRGGEPILDVGPTQGWRVTPLDDSSVSSYDAWRPFNFLSLSVHLIGRGCMRGERGRLCFQLPTEPVAPLRAGFRVRVAAAPSTPDVDLDALSLEVEDPTVARPVPYRYVVPWGALDLAVQALSPGRTRIAFRDRAGVVVDRAPFAVAELPPSSP